MPAAAGRRTATSPAPPSRLRLRSGLPGRSLLDGGWWPRSADPAAELPGLILAIDQQHPAGHLGMGRRERGVGPVGFEPTLAGS